jgi:stage III sporulation protein AG
LIKWLSWLDHKLQATQGGNRKPSSTRWLLLIFLLGLCLMLIHSFVTVKDVRTIVAEDPVANVPLAPTFKSDERSLEQQKFRTYESAYQDELRTILQKIIGTDEVDVMVTIESTEELIVEKNIQDTNKSTKEQDAKQTSRQISETTRNGQVVLYQVSSNQQPLIVKIIKPKIRGVIVIARGAEQLAVKKMMIEAVERGLDVAPHRISVLPRKHMERN